MTLLLLCNLASASPGTDIQTDTVAYASLAGGLGFLLENIGDFAIGVEHVRGHHGLLAEGTFIHVHGDPTHATTYGGQIGYRYHFDITGPFVGIIAGYEVGGAKYFLAEHGGPYDHFDLTHRSLVPHLGYRWGIGEHGAITARFGAGYGDWSIEGENPQSPDEAVLLQDRLQFTRIKLDSELSVGWRF